MQGAEAGVLQAGGTALQRGVRSSPHLLRLASGRMMPVSLKSKLGSRSAGSGTTNGTWRIRQEGRVGQMS